MQHDAGSDASKAGGFAALIDDLQLSDQQKRFLRARWLDQLQWLDGRANEARDRYAWLRLIAIIGGVVLPTLVGLQQTGAWAGELAKVLSYCISLAVAVSVAVENFFRWGERWRQYRRSAEQLTAEGWRFLQLTGGYREFPDHASACPIFAERVEALLGEDLEQFVARSGTETGRGGSGAG